MSGSELSQSPEPEYYLSDESTDALNVSITNTPMKLNFTAQREREKSMDQRNRRYLDNQESPTTPSTFATHTPVPQKSDLPSPRADTSPGGMTSETRFSDAEDEELDGGLRAKSSTIAQRRTAAHDDFSESSSETGSSMTDDDEHDDAISVTSSTKSIVLYHSVDNLQYELLKNYKNWYSAYKHYRHIPDELNAFERRKIDTNSTLSQRKGDSKMATQRDAMTHNDLKHDDNIIDCISSSIGYCLWVEKFENVFVPKELVEDLSNVSTDYRLHLNFFHTGTQSFFGRTFKSQPTNRVKTTQKSGNFLKQSVTFDLPIFFHSSIMDSSVVVIAECVASIKSNGAVMRHVSVGWSILRLFTDDTLTHKIPSLRKCLSNNLMDLRKGTKVLVDDVYKGTPRSLFNIREPLEVPLMPHAGTKLVYHFFTHTTFKKHVSHLVAEDDFVTYHDELPGLRETALKFLEPTLESTSTLQLYNLKVALPPTMERDLMHYLDEARFFEQGKQIDTDKSIAIMRRYLKIGVHNTCAFVKPYGTPTHLELLTTKQVEPTGHAVELELSGSINMRKFIEHGQCALVMELHYDVGIPVPLKTKIKKEGGLFGMFAKRRKETKKNTEMDYKTRSICIGQYILLPYADPIFKSNIACDMEVGPARSVTGNLIYAPRRIKGVAEAPKMSFSLLGLDSQASYKATTWNADASSRFTSRTPLMTPKIPKSPHRSKRAKTPRLSLSPVPTPESTIIQSPPHAVQLKVPPPVEPELVMSPKREPTIPKLDFDLTSYDKIHEHLDGLSVRSEKKEPTVSMKHHTGIRMEDAHFSQILDVHGNIVQDTGDDANIQHYDKPLPVDQVYIQFLAFTPPTVLRRQDIPERLHFQFQFFNKPESNTVNSPLELKDNLHMNDAMVLASPVLTQNGLVLKFNMDPNEVSPSEWKRYTKYLETQSLFVTVYDSLTKFKYGSICMPLRFALRKDNHEISIQHTREYHIVESFEEIFSPSRKSVRESQNLLQGKGKLLIRVSNVGSFSEWDSSQTEKRRLEYEQETRSVPRGPKVIEARALRSDTKLAALLGEGSSHATKKMNLDTSRNYGSNAQNDRDMLLKQRALSVRLYKESQKDEVLRQAYSHSHVTEKKLIYVSFGISEYFTIQFSNIERAASTCSLRCTSSSLCVVSRSEEMTLQNHPSQDYSVISLGANVHDVVVKPRRSTKVLFKFLEMEDPNFKQYDAEIQIMKGEHIVRTVVVRVIPTPVEIHQRLEFFAPALQPFYPILAYDRDLFGVLESPRDDQAMVYVKATNSVVASVGEENQINLTVDKQSHMHSTTFFVMLYADPFHNNLEQIWYITVHHVKQLPLKAVFGQRVYFNNNNIRPHIMEYLNDNSSCEYHTCRCVSSRNRELKVHIETSTPLKELTSFQGSYRPLTNSDEVRESSALVQLIDSQNEMIISRYLIKVAVDPPAVTKRFAERVKIGESLKRKLSFTNSFGERKMFYVSTNYPHLVRFAETKFELEPNQQQAILMRFDSKVLPGMQRIYVFVNNFNPDDPKSVDHDTTFCCFSIEVTYYE
eukprot:CAMPEP_0117441180 /NCGR_PEP_ID=MMETSP0759-20121206/3499_1 /TAXON_ID=63605 /ORGANISM="Percolomonas cosmopolitus, Strain WS" /LENGTH=1548 /DNA_ID=CAMNT_0005233021 /DNA_START=766 /DNA_END=5412 /DNA_ORIENTATION=-